MHLVFLPREKFIHTLLIKLFQQIFQDHIKANQYLAALRFASSWLISILLVRSIMTEEDIGVVEYVVFLAVNCSFFLTYAFLNSALSVIPKNDESEHNQVLSEYFYTSLITGIIAGIIVYLSGEYFLVLIKKESFVHLIPSIAFMTFLMVIGGWAKIVYLIRNSAYSLVVFGTTVYGLKLVLILIGILINPSIQLIVNIFLIWELVKCIWGIISIKPRIQYLSWGKIKYILWAVFPLGIHFLLGKGIDFFNGNMVMTYFDEKLFLYYSYGAREIPFSNLFLGAMSAAFIPLLSKDLKGNLPLVRERLRMFLNWITPLSIVLIIISPYLFTWIYSESFLLSSRIFNVFILFLVSRFLMPQIIIYAHGENRVFMILTFLELLIHIALCFLLIDKMGIMGVAVATVLSTLLNSIFGVIYCKLKYGIELKEYLPVYSYSIWMSLLVITYILTDWII